MNRPTISPEYLEQQKILHQNPNYGVASLSFAPIIDDFIRQTGVNSISDYGAGKKTYCLGCKGMVLTRYNIILLTQHLKSMVSQCLQTLYAVLMFWSILSRRN